MGSLRAPCGRLGTKTCHSFPQDESFLLSGPQVFLSVIWKLSTGHAISYNKILVTSLGAVSHRIGLATPKLGVFLHSSRFGLATLPAGLAVTGESKGTPGRKPLQYPQTWAG